MINLQQLLTLFPSSSSSSSWLLFLTAWVRFYLSQARTCSWCSHRQLWDLARHVSISIVITMIMILGSLLLNLKSLSSRPITEAGEMARVEGTVGFIFLSLRDHIAPCLLYTPRWVFYTFTNSIMLMYIVIQDIHDTCSGTLVRLTCFQWWGTSGVNIFKVTPTSTDWEVWQKPCSI